MTDPRQLLVYVRGRDLSNLGPVGDYASVELHPRYNDVGSWQLTCPENSRAPQLLLGVDSNGTRIPGGGGIRVFRRDNPDGPPLLTGPIRGFGFAFDSSGPGTWTFTGNSDNEWLTHSAAFPVPGQPVSAQTATAYDNRTGPAESVIKAYVNVNAGPGAPAAYQVAHLTIAPDLARGPTVKGSARFDNLLTLVQSLATAGAIGWQVTQQGGSLVLDCYLPNDKSATVRFSRASSSLVDGSFSIQAPSVTDVIVAGSGNGTARAFAERTNAQVEADWNMRIVSFVDSRETADTAQLQQSGDESLTEGAVQAQIAFTPIDAPGRRYGIDYALGDKVTVELAPGVRVVDVVREVAIVDSAADGLSVKPVVGAFGAADPSTSLDLAVALRKVAVALGLLQRRQ